MLRSDITRKISNLYSNINLAQAEEAVKIILDVISYSLILNKRVELRGFGVFTVRKRRSHLGLNPSSKEKILIEAKVVPCFKSSKLFKAQLNS